jgi:hypothetical protein
MSTLTPNLPGLAPRPAPCGPLVSPRAAAHLVGATETEVLALIAAGRVRAERIKGKLFISLNDLDDAAGRPRGGVRR